MKIERPWNTTVSGLVVTLVENAESRRVAVARIQEHEALQVEEAQGCYLPVTIENTDARQIHRWLESLPGVAYVDVVFCSTLNPESEEPVLL